MSDDHAAKCTAIPHRLGMWDAVSIIVGIVVGTAIFRSPSMVFQNVTGPWQALGVWLLGGVLCLFGAVCYAELATTYPRNGGDYEYLSRAFGRWSGFLFGWAQLSVILTGSIGAMAYTFADYAAGLWQRPSGEKVWIAAGAVIALSLLNLLGVLVGKSLQNVLSLAKVVGLLGVVLAGLLCGSSDDVSECCGFARDGGAGTGTGPGLRAVCLRRLERCGLRRGRSPRSAAESAPCADSGTGRDHGDLLAVNAAYLAVLGFDAARSSATPAADVAQLGLGPWGAKAISLLVMVSALGAINGMILAGSRVYATVGEDHPLFGWLGKWSSKGGAPVAALLTQAAIALLLVFGVGTAQGQAAIDRGLAALGLAGLPWEAYFGGFETLVAGTAPVFWAFFLLTGISLFVLRPSMASGRGPSRYRSTHCPRSCSAACVRTCSGAAWIMPSRYP